MIDAQRTGTLFGDYRAFVCAGTAIVHGENPYGYAPLYACESQPSPGGLYAARDGVALPAPLPGYALAFFALLSLFPLVAGALVWLATLCAAFFMATRALARLGVPAYASLAALAFPIGAVALPFGEVVPVALAACAGAAAALKRHAHTQAVGWMALSMIEPHVGLSVACAMLVPAATRMRAIAAMLILGALHLVVLRQAAVPYFVHVLPQHALAELFRSSQYSLSWIAAQFGVSARGALALGTVSYGLMLVAGVTVAWILSLRRQSYELYALVPPAFAVAGGSFMHLAQTALAIPAALVLLSSTRGAMRAVLSAAILLLAIPWNVVAQTPPLLAFVPLVLVALAAWLFRMRAIPSLAVALAGTLVAGMMIAIRAHAVAGTAPLPLLDPELAQANWGAWIARNDSAAGIAIWSAKAPTWIALLAVVLAGCGLSYEEKGGLRTRSDTPPVVGA